MSFWREAHEAQETYRTSGRVCAHNNCLWEKVHPSVISARCADISAMQLSLQAGAVLAVVQFPRFSG